MGSKFKYNWNIDTTKVLIRLYEENECLYNKSLKDYKNRDVRLAIAARMANIISGISKKVCLVSDIRRKINSLRSQYLAEKMKIIKSKQYGEGDYIPTVYWYPLLHFLEASGNVDSSQEYFEDEYIESNLNESTDRDTPPIHKPEVIKQSKRKRLSPKSSESDETCSLYQEATTSYSPVAQHPIIMPEHKDNHITTFCNFINSELSNILEASNMEFVNTAKRKIQMCLFQIWDEIDSMKLIQINNIKSEHPAFVQNPGVSLLSCGSQHNNTRNHSLQRKRNKK